MSCVRLELFSSAIIALLVGLFPFRILNGDMTPPGGYLPPHLPLSGVRSGQANVPKRQCGNSSLL